MLDVKPFPDTFYKVEIKKKLTDDHLKRIKVGKQPDGMDDRWIIYFEEPWLYFHRSWTGTCIYKVHLLQKEGTYEIDEILVNGDIDQYKGKDENEPEQFITIFELFLESKI